MVWTIATATGVTTITPDGTSNENLVTLLDSAIAGSQSGITKIAVATPVYRITNTLVIAGVASDVFFLHVAGLTLLCEARFLRNARSRVKFTDLAKDGSTNL